jgi:hypothetical protein
MNNYTHIHIGSSIGESIVIVIATLLIIGSNLLFSYLLRR